MSGGSHGYVYCQIESELCGQMHDKELDDLMWDIKELAHDLEWMDSSDISPEKYAETVRRFKQKWFNGGRTERLQGYIDDAIRHTREELLTMIGAGAPAAPVIFDDGKVRAVLVTGHQTNGDLLRAMTDEQLVRSIGLACKRCAYYEISRGECSGQDRECAEGNLKWIKREAKTDDT